MIIRLYPTLVQKTHLKTLFDANRWAWNIVHETIGSVLWSKSVKELGDMARPRVKKMNIDPTTYISKAPEEVFDSAYRDYFKARKTIMGLYKANRQKSLSSLDFKRLKDPSQSIEIRARTVQNEGLGISIYPMIFGKKSILRTKEPVPAIDYSIRLVRKYSTYYIHIPMIDQPIMDHSIQTEFGSERHRFVSIDPGVRVMLTGYDPQGSSFEIGTEPGWKHIAHKQRAIDSLNRKLETSISSRVRMRIRKQIANTYRKVRNCLNDMHHKVSKWLLQRYENIILPSFGVKDMTQKQNPVTGKYRTIGKKTTRKMLTWGHFQFMSILTKKAKRYGTNVHVCTEEYTSMTCSMCGRLNHTLGSSKWFVCPYNECSHHCDRDLNAARNIILKTY